MKRCLIVALLSGLILWLPGCAEEEKEPDDKVIVLENLTVLSAGAKDGWSQHPAILADSRGWIHVVWSDNGPMEDSGEDFDIFYKYWDGTAWSGVEVVSDDEADGESIHPCLAIDSQKNIHIVWQDSGNVGDSGLDYDILYKKKEEGQWGSTTVISDDDNDGDSIKPQIALDINDNIYVVWSDDGDIGNSGTDYDIVYRYWDGAAWGATTVITDDANDGTSVQPAIAIDATGWLHVVWSDNGDIGASGPDYDIIYRIWNGTAWSAITAISDHENDGTSTQPDIDIFQKDVFIVWVDDGDIEESGPDSDILYRSWDNIKLAWSDIMVVSDELGDDISQSPRIAVRYDVRRYILWSDTGDIFKSGRDNDILFRYWDSYDWSTTLVLSDDRDDGASIEPAISADVYTYAHLVWVDSGNIGDSSTDQDILYKRLIK